MLHVFIKFFPIILRSSPSPNFVFFTEGRKGKEKSIRERKKEKSK